MVTVGHTGRGGDIGGGGGGGGGHVIVCGVVWREEVAGRESESVESVRWISRKEGCRVHSTVDFHAVRRRADSCSTWMESCRVTPLE